jgi:hypothetical protein
MSSEDVSLARWETRGKDWLELFKYKSDKHGTVYHYRGNGCGGGVTASTDEEAIAAMENPWGHPNGTGQVTVLKTDRPSVRRVK